MREIESAFGQLVRANPVPDPSALLEEFELGSNEAWMTRSDQLSTTKTPAPTRSLKNRMSWIPATAIAVVVLLVGVTASLTDGFGLAGGNERSPVELAEAYMEARNAHDADRWAELFSKEATIVDIPPVADLSELSLFAEVEAQFELQFSPYECSVAVDNERMVTCTYELDSRLQRVLGEGPVSGEISIFTEDGKVTLTAHSFPSAYEEAWFPFGDFLVSEGVFNDIYRADSRGTQLTPEAVSLHGEYLDRYEQSRAGG
jgi:hypothetical protein